MNAYTMTDTREDGTEIVISTIVAESLTLACEIAEDAMDDRYAGYAAGIVDAVVSVVEAEYGCLCGHAGCTMDDSTIYYEL